MPLATAGIGSVTGNRNAQKSQDYGKPMKHFVCRNNELTELVKGERQRNGKQLNARQGKLDRNDDNESPTLIAASTTTRKLAI